MRALSSQYYGMDAVSLARTLVGARLFRSCAGELSGGTIVETEAYCGVLDRACHAFGFRRTARTEPMYGPPGTAYVYLIYGLHHCLNVVCLRREEPQAVLIRAIRPERGLERMAIRRGRSALVGGAANPELTNGPGKLCEALAVDRSCNGLKFDRAPLLITEGRRSSIRIQASRRVGLGRVGEFAAFPWRFRGEET